MILITGFEAFGGHSFNPSQALIESFTSLKNSHYHRLLLSVDWNLARIQLAQAYAATNYQAVFHFGLAQGRANISLERYAFNCCGGGLKDNLGLAYFKDTPIFPKGASFLETSINLDNIKDCLDQFSLKSEITFDAGRYLCNYVYYYSLLQKSLQPEPLRGMACFIHLPLLQDREQLDQLTQAFGVYLKQTYF